VVAWLHLQQMRTGCKSNSISQVLFMQAGPLACRDCLPACSPCAECRGHGCWCCCVRVRAGAAVDRGGRRRRATACERWCGGCSWLV
jgi:hypothetical protein